MEGEGIIMEPKVIPGIYEHYKGNKYLVLGIAGHSETEERMVVYVTLYETQGPGMWVRPLDMFTETVEWEGKHVPRFRYLGPELAS